MNGSKLVLVALWLQCKKDWDSIYKALLNKTSPDEFFIEEAKKYIRTYTDKNILTPLDEEWRNLGLGKIKRPPFVVNLKECN